MQAVIMAGGKGTRLIELTKNEIPKPMVPICGKPLLEWQLECLKANGIRDVIFVIGHLGNKIREHFSDGSLWDMKFQYIEETEPLGTAGSFYYLKQYLSEDYFLLVFGDVLFEIDLSRIEKFHVDNHSLATLLVHPNNHPWDSDLVLLDENNYIQGFDSKHNDRVYWYDNCVNAGLYIFDRSLCKQFDFPQKRDLEKDVLLPLIINHAPILGYHSSEYIKDVGTVERITGAIHDIQSGIISMRCLKNKQKCIFLDCNEIIHTFNSTTCPEEELQLEDDVTNAIRILNSSSYLGISITTQPNSSGNLYLFENDECLRKKISTLLGRAGAYLDDVVFCNFSAENTSKKISEFGVSRSNQKAQIEMIYNASEKYNLDLSSSWLIGNVTSDFQVAKKAGLKTALVSNVDSRKETAYITVHDLICQNLEETIVKILEE